MWALQRSLQCSGRRKGCGSGRICHDTVQTQQMHFAGAAALPTMPARAAAKAGGEQQTPGLRRVQPGASLAAILSGGPKYRCGLPLHASLHLM